MAQVSHEIEGEALEAAAWDNGCQNDNVRNQFLIPRLIALLSEERPMSILDIGSGTGYVSRHVDAKLSYRPEWTLVDISSSRMKVAIDHKPVDAKMNFYVGNLSELALAGNGYQAILLTFTLLEARDTGAMLESAIHMLHDGGILAIAMPDVWKDAIAISDASPAALHDLMRGTVDLPKIDKFTGAPYPFRAMRNETLISTVLSHFFVLEALERGGAEGEAYLLIFRKKISPRTTQLSG